MFPLTRSSVCTYMSLMMKPSRASSSLVASPSTITHLFSYESSSSVEPVLPSTEKPCKIQPFKSNPCNIFLWSRRFRYRHVTTANRRPTTQFTSTRAWSAISIGRFRQYSAGNYCRSRYSIYTVRSLLQAEYCGGSWIACCLFLGQGVTTGK